MNGISPSVQGRGGAHDISRMVSPLGEFNLSITFDRGGSVVVDADMFGNLAKNKWFPDGNVCSSQPYVSREPRRLCSGPAQVCSGLLTPLLREHGATKTNLTRNHQLLMRGPKRPLLWLGIPNMLPLLIPNQQTDTETAIQEVIFLALTRRESLSKLKICTET